MLEAVEANVRVLKALFVMLVREASGMTLGEALQAGCVGVLEVIETIRSADAPPPSRSKAN